MFVRPWLVGGVVGCAVVLGTSSLRAAPAIKVLIVDGQNNHDWKATTPVLQATLEETGAFAVDVATAPSQDTTGFRPKFSDYQAVLSNYNGADWPRETQEDLVNYVKSGGGLVIVHAADNSFGNWREYNEMIGLGGWGGRNEKSGPYIRFRSGQFVRDTTPGGGGSHGAQHDFQVVIRQANHPITAGMPAAWLHVKDELYDRLRGPAENMTVLATALAATDQGGSGEHEPMIFTIDYGQGRVFHTPMGHGTESLQCVGFQGTLQRGTQWAAIGKVTLPLPADFPAADRTSRHEPRAKPLAASSGRRPHVVFVTGDHEYRSEVSMPMIAKILAAKHNMRCTVCYAKPTPQSDANIEGLDALQDADLAVFYLRWRVLPDEQMQKILDYVGSGRPLVGLRTTTHSFKYPAESKFAAWSDGFGRDIFGQKWFYHHGHTSSTDAANVPEAKDHPILRGVEPTFHVRSWLYHVLPLEGDCTPLVVGTAVDSEQKVLDPNPVAWTKTYKNARVFFTTLGHPEDFQVESMRRLLINGIYWSLGLEVPTGGANAEIQGEYQPPATS